MTYQEEVLYFKQIELAKMKHPFDSTIKVDILPFSFVSESKKKKNDIKCDNVHMVGVGELALTKLCYDIPDVLKVSPSFIKLFSRAFASASHSKSILKGDYDFYPNFSQVSYKMILEKIAIEMIGLSLTPIDLMVYRAMTKEIEDKIESLCLDKFGPDYREKSVESFAKEFPRLDKESALLIKEKKAS